MKKVTPIITKIIKDYHLFSVVWEICQAGPRHVLVIYVRIDGEKFQIKTIMLE